MSTKQMSTKQRNIKKRILMTGLYCIGIVATAQPAWTVLPTQYQSTMSVTLQLNVEGTLSTDINNQIGVFYGNECRGTARVNYEFNQQQYALLTLYGNTSGERLTVKVYEAASGKIYDLKQTFIFKKDSILGSFEVPVVLYTDLHWKKLNAYNFFTPNNDGKNDYFIVDDILAVSGMTFKIHTPQGMEVYHQQDYDNTWNGVDSRGKDLPKGVYYYLFTAEDGSIVYKGSITLVR